MVSVIRISRKEAKGFLAMFHYLGSVKGGSICYGMFETDSSLKGVACFYGGELSRFALADGAPKNTASRYLTVITREFFIQNLGCSVLRSFADVFQGHKGTIYKAAGWKQVSSRRSIVLKSGEKSYSGKYCLERAFAEGVRSGELVSSEKLCFELKRN